MISFLHTYKVYQGNVIALKDVSLQVDKGEFVYLTGPSGAGKTTLFRLLSAYDRCSSGQITVANYNLNKIKPHDIPKFRRSIGVVYQDFRLLKDRNIFANVALPLQVQSESQHLIQSRVSTLLEQVGLMAKSHFYPSQLSGGEQQRVAIARALVHQPSIVIADEPTGNLDSDLSREIMNLFDQVSAQGTTVFIATHDQELIRTKARRVVRIQSGSILRDEK